jgi:hypothetical protein
MKAPLIRKVGGECVPAYQRYREQPDAHCAKAQGRRKYIFTDQIDQLIRETYLSHPGAKTRPGIPMLAKKVGIPHWALKKRARELGLARAKEQPWSTPELEILEHYAWMSDDRIRLKLKAAGYSRSATGIHLKLRRMQFKHDPSFYSASGLAQALGIDSHAVLRWIRSGHLKAQFRGTARGEQQNGDIYLIREKDVRRFIVEHPTDIDLRKVDQLWFIDLISNGLARTACTTARPKPAHTGQPTLHKRVTASWTNASRRKMKAPSSGALNISS